LSLEFIKSAAEKCGENQNTHFVRIDVSSENRDGKETIWKNNVAYCKVWLGAEVL
jgi:hypothetical protein